MIPLKAECLKSNSVGRSALLHSLGSSDISFSVSSEVWEFVQNSSPFVGSETDVLVGEEVDVNASDAEISTGELFSSDEATSSAIFIDSLEIGWENNIEDIWVHGFLCFFSLSEMWSIDFANDLLVCVHHFVNLESSHRVLWVEAVFNCEHSHDGNTLSETSSIFKFETWHLTVWHGWLECWPLWESDDNVLPVGTCLVEKLSNWFSSDIEVEVVEFVAHFGWLKDIKI